MRPGRDWIAVSFRVFDRQIDDTIVRERLLAMLSIFFAAVAALLGLYGVIAYGVTKRTNEIGAESTELGKEAV